MTKLFTVGPRAHYTVEELNELYIGLTEKLTDYLVGPFPLSQLPERPGLYVSQVGTEFLPYAQGYWRMYGQKGWMRGDLRPTWAEQETRPAKNNPDATYWWGFTQEFHDKLKAFHEAHSMV